jgi:hypothetical protein
MSARLSREGRIIMKQFIVGILITTILGAGLFSLYQGTQAGGVAAPAVESASIAAPPAPPVSAPPVAAAESAPLPAVVAGPPAAVAQAEPLTVSASVASDQPVAAAPNTFVQQRGHQFGQETANTTPGTPQVQAQTHMTTTLSYSGAVQAVEMTGLSLLTTAGEPVWVQFGQSRFWQSQGVNLAVGDQVTVTGFSENGQFQAISVTNHSNGQLLTLRDSSGRPLWAGGNGFRGQR